MFIHIFLSLISLLLTLERMYMYSIYIFDFYVLAGILICFSIPIALVGQFLFSRTYIHGQEKTNEQLLLKQLKSFSWDKDTTQVTKLVQLKRTQQQQLYFSPHLHTRIDQIKNLKLDIEENVQTLKQVLNKLKALPSVLSHLSLVKDTQILHFSRAIYVQAQEVSEQDIHISDWRALRELEVLVVVLARELVVLDTCQQEFIDLETLRSELHSNPLPNSLAEDQNQNQDEDEDEDEDENKSFVTFDPQWQRFADLGVVLLKCRADARDLNDELQDVLDNPSHTPSNPTPHGSDSLSVTVEQLRGFEERVSELEAKLNSHLDSDSGLKAIVSVYNDTIIYPKPCNFLQK